MDYILGSFTTTMTIVVVYVCLVLIKNKLEKEISRFSIKYSQSRLLTLTKDIFLPKEEVVIERQSSQFKKAKGIRVIISDNLAYWIKDNCVYVADMVNGYIVQDSARKLDIFALDDVELKRVEFIIDKLTEGLGNDSWNSRN